MIHELGPNRPPERFYRGGRAIAAFRGEPPAAEREPEDWIGSVTTVRGEAELGLTRLPDGRLLRDAVAEDPVSWLGAEHAARWGADVRLLVKLLDAGQRLPVHAHPDDGFAGRHLGCRHGKAEAWYILEGGTVHVGLTQEVSVDELADLVRSQDVDALLGLLHAVRVEPGDVVWVPPGELHAIGEGVFLLELQQPEDLSILLEWEGFAIDGAAEGHLGLGFDRALAAVNRGARRVEELAELVRPAPRPGAGLPASGGPVLPAREAAGGRAGDRRRGLLPPRPRGGLPRDRWRAGRCRLDLPRARKPRTGRGLRRRRAARGSHAHPLTRAEADPARPVGVGRPGLTFGVPRACAVPSASLLAG